jgi:hypothetical protein
VRTRILDSGAGDAVEEATDRTVSNAYLSQLEKGRIREALAPRAAQPGVYTSDQFAIDCAHRQGFRQASSLRSALVLGAHSSVG